MEDVKERMKGITEHRMNKGYKGWAAQERVLSNKRFEIKTKKCACMEQRHVI